MRIEFTADYSPFNPPTITFLNKIYHPNVEESGKIYVKAISPDKWKPATRMEEGKSARQMGKGTVGCLVIREVLEQVDNPDMEHPVRADVAEEYEKKRNAFINTANRLHAKEALLRTELRTFVPTFR